MFTAEQMFWIAHGSYHCKDALKEYGDGHADSHPPGALRVTAAFANAQEYAADWSLPPDSPMIPAERVDVF